MPSVLEFSVDNGHLLEKVVLKVTGTNMMTPAEFWARFRDSDAWTEEENQRWDEVLEVVKNGDRFCNEVKSFQSARGAVAHARMVDMPVSEYHQLLKLAAQLSTRVKSHSQAASIC